MANLELGPQDSLYYEYAAPEAPGGCTFAFFNALTGDTGTWEALIGPRLREAGHGTLAYNMRGQADSHFSPGLVLDTAVMVNDAIELLDEVRPARPVLVEAL